MDKRKAIQIMTRAADLYRDNLEDQKVLFLYGVSSEVKKQLLTEGQLLTAIKGYEVAFHGSNFLHLTGVKLNKEKIDTAKHFYQKCLDRRLSENDFSFAKDDDSFVADWRDWKRFFEMNCLVCEYPGNHFFIFDSFPNIVDQIVSLCI